MLNSRRIRFLSAVVLCVIGTIVSPSGGVDAAEVLLSVASNRDTVEWGSPLVYRVRVQRHPTDQVELVPEAFPGPFEIREPVDDPVVTDLEDGRVQEVRDFVLRAFEPGVLEIPPVTARIRTAEGDTGSIRSRSIVVVVVDLDPADGFVEYDGSQKSIPADLPWWFWVAGAALVVGLLILVVRWWRREKPLPEATPDLPVDWREEVAAVEALGLVAKGETKRHYSLLSDVFRHFFEKTSGIESMERTTSELKGALAGSYLSGRVGREIISFLAEVDLVKFAKVEPGPDQAAASATQVRRLMDAVEEALVPAVPETEALSPQTAASAGEMP
jgi:hypothetical protein